MPFSKQEIEELVRLVALTDDAEINCQQCLALVAEFAEQRLVGKSLSDSLRAVEEHLDICVECREEYQALRRAIGELNDY